MNTRRDLVMSWFDERLKKKGLEAGTHEKCPECLRVISKEEVLKRQRICPKCGYHFAPTAQERIGWLLDPGTFVELNSTLASGDPLAFVDRVTYPARLQDAQVKTGMTEAVLTGIGKIRGHEVVIGAMDRRFIGASMGSVVGEKIALAFEEGLKRRAPVILVISSGGARMQEGYFSLQQMTKTCAAAALLKEANIPFIGILTDPTYGGVTASFVALADVLFAEPGARIGFAGRNVIEQTIHEKLPEEFQTAEFLRDHGLIDGVYARLDQRNLICKLLDYFARNEAHPTGKKTYPKPRRSHQPLPFEKELDGLEAELKRLKRVKAESYPNLEAEVAELEAMLHDQVNKIHSGDLEPIHRVQISRHIDRPRSADYLKACFYDVIELNGGGRGVNDPAIITALASLGNRRVMVIAHSKGWDTKSNASRNFGSPTAQGFWKAQRAMELADKYGLPIITLIDTAGAYPGSKAEECGVGQAIGECIAKLSRVKVPVVCVVIGEGGSGGALGIGHGDRLLMLENSYYSVISPEGAKAILFKDAGEVSRAAEVLRLTADELQKLGFVDLLIPEPIGGAHRDPRAMYPRVERAIAEALGELLELDRGELVRRRYERIRSVGSYQEVPHG